MPRKKKKPVGHPPIYDSNHHPQDLIDKMGQLWLDVQVYASWGISRKTFYQWLQTHEDFSDAYDIGMAQFEAGVSQKIKDIGDGHLDARHSLNAWLAIANRKCKWNQAPANEVNIHINNMNILANKSTAELLKIVQSDIKELELLDDSTTTVDCSSTTSEEYVEEAANTISGSYEVIEGKEEI